MTLARPFPRIKKSKKNNNKLVLGTCYGGQNEESNCKIARKEKNDSEGASQLAKGFRRLCECARGRSLSSL